MKDNAVDAAAVGHDVAAATQVDTHPMARRDEAALLHQPRAVRSAWHWSGVLEASAEQVWPAPRQPASSTPSMRVPPVLGPTPSVPQYPRIEPYVVSASVLAAAAPPVASQVYQAPPLLPAAAEAALHLAGAAPAEAPLWEDKASALWTYAPALQDIGLQWSTLQDHVALPGGPQLLAEMARYLPILNACGVNPGVVSQAVTQAAGAMDIGTLGTYVPVLLHLGWPQCDILQLATAPNGAQALAELAYYAPTLLAHGFSRPSLAECALVPGALNILLCNQPCAAASQEAPSELAPAHMPPSFAGQRLRVPISFTQTELSQLRSLPLGQERVDVLKMFRNHWDGARLDKAALLALAGGVHGAHRLMVARGLAPVFFDRGIDINCILAILLCKGGTCTLKTLDKVYPALQMLRFHAAALVRMATRPDAHVWLKALAEHTGALFLTGWTPDDIVSLSNMPQAHRLLDAVRSEGGGLWSLGFTASEQLAIIKMGSGEEPRQQVQTLWPQGLALGFEPQQLKNTLLERRDIHILAVLIECAPSFLAAGFSAQQCLQMVGSHHGKLKVKSLRALAPQLLAHGYTHHNLVSTAIKSSNPDIFWQLQDTSSKLIGLSISCDTLHRAANHAHGVVVLRTIKRHWKAMCNRVADAERRLCEALDSYNDAEAFKRWMKHHADQPALG